MASFIYLHVLAWLGWLFLRAPLLNSTAIPVTSARVIPGPSRVKQSEVYQKHSRDTAKVTNRSIHNMKGCKKQTTNTITGNQHPAVQTVLANAGGSSWHYLPSQTDIHTPTSWLLGVFSYCTLLYISYPNLGLAPNWICTVSHTYTLPRSFLQCKEIQICF